MPASLESPQKLPSPATAGELYGQAEACFRQGRFEAALERVEAFLRRRPAHGNGWNLAGLCRHAMGDYERALRCFERAAQQPDEPEEAVANMVRTCLAAGKLPQAARLLKRLPGPADESLVLDLAGRLEAENRLHEAACLLFEMKDRLSSKSRAEQKLLELRQRRARLAVFCGGDGMTFLKEILEFLDRRYQVRIFDGADTRQMQELMQWSDISWFEWCSNLAVLGSQLPRVCRTVIRLHRYEAYMPWPGQINWDHVDLLVTVGNSAVIQALETGVPDLRRRTRLIRIPNGVNVEKIPFRRRSQGKAIAFVASMRMVKNPMLLLQCMARLHACDPEYHLHIAGRMDDLLVEQYFLHQVKALGLEKVVHFDGWQDDIAAWLADKHYIAATSVIESQGMGILEAMAAGLKPVIHNFPGAAENFSSEYLFNTPDEFCDLVLSEDYNSDAYRQFVECRYPLHRTLMQVDEILAALEQRPVGSAPQDQRAAV